MVFSASMPVGFGKMRERRIRRMKFQRNERDEAVRVVLRFAQPHQMIDALFERFHVAEKHRGIRAQADFVRGARDLKPHLAADFVVADDAAHARMENFRAAAGQRIHARFFHLRAACRESKASRGARSSAPRPS